MFLTCQHTEDLSSTRNKTFSKPNTIHPYLIFSSLTTITHIYTCTHTLQRTLRLKILSIRKLGSIRIKAECATLNLGLSVRSSYNTWPHRTLPYSAKTMHAILLSISYFIYCFFPQCLACGPYLLHALQATLGRESVIFFWTFLWTFLWHPSLQYQAAIPVSSLLTASPQHFQSIPSSLS